MSFESPEQTKEVPSEMKDYEKLWAEMYGKPVEGYYEKLKGLAEQLSGKDEEFSAILDEQIVKNFKENEDSRSKKNKAWVYISSLSAYGKRFGLTVD
jgi:hypothetical protein